MKKNQQKLDKETLIKDEQAVLDGVIQKLDQRMMELNRRLTESQLRIMKSRGWADAYGELIDAQKEKEEIKNDKKFLKMAQSDLYKYHMKLQFQDMYGDEETGEYDLKIGMHSYGKGDDIYVLRWNNAACRPFIMDNSLEEAEVDVKGDKTKYILKLKREIELDFDEVTDVLHLFPLSEDDELVVYDSFLKELIKRRSEQEFKNIVFSIQKKQGEIVQIPYKQDIIVQGCAGSGKTMILLHRLPILLEDNPGVLIKNSIYVVSPSTQYIQMMEGLREDLEIDDLSMGTIDDYYRYSIERYGHKISECGRINPLLDMKKEQLDYVYSYDGLSRLILSLIDEQMMTGDVNLSLGQDLFRIKERLVSNQTVKDIIHKKLLQIQDILNENEKRLHEQSGIIQNFILAYQKLEQTLHSRRSAEEREIDREIHVARESILKQEQEIEKLNPILNFVAIRNKRTAIKEQNAVIDRLEQEKSELATDHYYEELMKISTSIHEFISVNTIGIDPDNHRDQYKTTAHYRKAKQEYIAKMYKFLQSDHHVGDHVQRVSQHLKGLNRPSRMKADSFDKQLDTLQKAANNMVNIQIAVLPYDYFLQLQKASDYFNEMNVAIETLTYLKVMKQLGYSSDQKGNLSVPSVAPYVFLKILSACNGPIDTRRDSLIAIDEAQNYTVEEIKLFREINGDSLVLNLFGDIHQKVEDEKGISTWDDLRVLGPFQTHFLNENYRNALQITEECNQRFGFDMEAINVKGTGVIEYRSISEFDSSIKKYLNKTSYEGLCCIIVKFQEEAKIFSENFSYFTDRINNMTDGQAELSRTKWNLLLVSQAKGLEFESVIVLSGRMTRNEKYIAFTRALDELIVFDLQYADLTRPLVTDEIGVSSYDENQSDSNEESLNQNQKSSTKIADRRPEREPEKKSELLAFLEGSGCEVIDMRKTSGRLWVINNGTQSKQVVKEAMSKFHVSFSQGKDKETKGRVGWYTKSNK